MGSFGFWPGMISRSSLIVLLGVLVSRIAAAGVDSGPQGRGNPSGEPSLSNPVTDTHAHVVVELLRQWPQWWWW